MNSEHNVAFSFHVMLSISIQYISKERKALKAKFFYFIMKIIMNFVLAFIAIFLDRSFAIHFEKAMVGLNRVRFIPYLKNSRNF